LPHTPPAKEQGESFAPLEAFKVLRVPAIMILFIVTFIDSLVHYMYFFWSSTFYQAIGLPENWIAPAMSIGQIAELATMALLGVVLKKLGWRTTMILGVLGHVFRFGVYAMADNSLLWLVILSNVVHGFAYAFFFATVYIYVDENFPKDVRTSAQSLFNMLILGFGPLASNFLSAWLLERYKTGDVIDFHQVFLVPLGLGLLATAILAIFFHPKVKDPVPAEV
jgi:MFS family permease